jgi:hypothetical protein
VLAQRTAVAILSLAGLLAFAQQPPATPKPGSSPAASGAQKAGQSSATVYVYRYKQFVGAALEPSVYCDDAQLARMDNGRYFVVKLQPGKHMLHSNDKQAGLELDAKPGQEYFVRVEIAAGMMKGHGRLVLMAAEQGKYELQSKKLKPLDAGKVVDQARVSVEEVRFDNAKDAGEAAK